MQSTDKSSEKASTFNILNVPIAAEVLLGLATAPFLLTLVASKAVSDLMGEIGRASEELFRGDRLPTLNPPSVEENK